MLDCQLDPLSNTHLLNEAESKALDKANRRGFLVMPPQPCFPVDQLYGITREVYGLPEVVIDARTGPPRGIRVTCQCPESFRAAIEVARIMGVQVGDINARIKMFSGFVFSPHPDAVAKSIAESSVCPSEWDGPMRSEELRR